MKVDATLESLYGNALDFSKEMGEKLNSFHFLLSCFVTPSEVAVLMEEQGVEPEKVAGGYRSLKKEYVSKGMELKEGGDVIKKVEEKVLSLLQSQDDIPSALHFLCAITNVSESIAYRILSHLRLLSPLRLQAFNMLATPAKRVKARMVEIRHESKRVESRREEEVGRTVLKEKKRVESGGLVEKKTVKPTPGKVEDKTGNFKLPPIFDKLGRNLSALAGEGQLDALYGREKEVETVLDILYRKKNNNPCLVGPAGSGKTAIVEGIAVHQRDGLLPGKILWELHLSSLLSGTEFRGSLEKRILELIEAVEDNKDRVIVFIDEIHMLNSRTNEVVANMLKPALARGNFPLIGATTTDEFKKHIATDPAMERRFSIVNVEEPKGEELFKIVKSAAPVLEKYHDVSFKDELLLRHAVALSDRYISGKSQPDKVLSLLDTLGAVLCRSGKKEAGEEDLNAMISKSTGIPMENLLVDGSRILRVLPEKLNMKIKGQNKAKRKICQLLARRYTRRVEGKPIASFLFAGPTGVGKSEMAKSLAQFFFGSESRMVAFDMSEFQEAHSVSRLIGSPPGYTGFEEGGQLTEAFRREPYQLLLLDEIEKAHPKVLTILLQLLDEGRVSDSRGFAVKMSEVVMIMTTNLGAEEFSSRLGFGGGNRDDLRENLVLSKIENFLSPELANRVDEIVVFNPLEKEDLEEVALLILNNMISGFKESYGLKVEYEDVTGVAEHLVGLMTMREKSLGARALKRVVEKRIEGLVLDFVYGEGTDSDIVICLDKNQSLAIRSSD